MNIRTSSKREPHPESRKPSRLRQQRGGATVDLAVVLPVFIALTIGVFDVGRAVWSYNTIVHVARDATRFAAVRSNVSDDPINEKGVADRIYSNAGALDAEKLDISTQWLPTNKPGAVVEISLSYSYDPIIPFVSADTIALSTTSRLTVSN